MGIIRSGFKLLIGFAIFSFGYYMGGGCEKTDINQEIKKEANYTKPAYYQTVDKKFVDEISSLKGLEKKLNLDYFTIKD